jgi:hypothetical protein
MTRNLLAAMALALVGSACAHADPAATSSAASPAMASPSNPAPAAGMAGMCPMNVPGTKVQAADTATGESLTFTTTSADQVAMLRDQVHQMSDMHNRHQASGDAGHGGPAGMGGMMGGGMMVGGMGGGGMSTTPMPMPPPSRTTVEDLYDGSRIIMTPTDPADLQRLQAAIRTRADHLTQQGCGMAQRS